MPTSYYARRSGRRPDPDQCRRLVRRASADRRRRPRQRHARPATPGPTRPGPSSRSTRRWSRSRAPASPSSPAARRRSGWCSATPGSASRASRPIRSTSSRSTLSRRTRCRCICSPARRLHVYGRAVQPDGIVLFHISNRYLDLKPVIADIAAREGWTAEILQYVPDEHEEALNATISVWIAMSRNAGDAGAAEGAERRRRASTGSWSSRGPASPAGATITPRSCRSSISGRCCRGR